MSYQIIFALADSSPETAKVTCSHVVDALKIDSNIDFVIPSLGFSATFESLEEFNEHIETAQKKTIVDAAILPPTHFANLLATFGVQATTDNIPVIFFYSKPEGWENTEDATAAAISTIKRLGLHQDGDTVGSTIIQVTSFEGKSLETVTALDDKIENVSPEVLAGDVVPDVIDTKKAGITFADALNGAIDD
ncbi:hypothetical protein BKA93DRAFT_829092 [Sparassis latifolia]|uniref:Uncharacterized protein n=1 Tax=Sparassis crispa TaxID=139825 RepID=A0A401H2K7_9APHY|nr:hypothetical protein SCP_1400280 [Sparassis crispa]GBE88623.1 hypothetical protein SCP_1400280 [Sparassis crispa]